jgi:hypothetical protein
VSSDGRATGAIALVPVVDNRKKNKRGSRIAIARVANDQARMHGSEASAIDNTIRKQWISTARALEPCRTSVRLTASPFRGAPLQRRRLYHPHC